MEQKTKASPAGRILRIGVTGGIGSGKSLVMEILEEEHGAMIILSDQVAHELMEPGAKSYQDILAAFGEEILKEDRTIDRTKLSAIVFSDPDKLSKLNGITHPNAIQEIRDRMAAFAREAAPRAGQNETDDPVSITTRDQGQDLRIIAVESALLLEAGMDQDFDSFWYVWADPEVRVKRLMEGREYTEDRARAVMASQKDDSYYRDRCQVVIDNSAGRQETAAQVDRAIQACRNGN